MTDMVQTREGAEPQQKTNEEEDQKMKQPGAVYHQPELVYLSARQ
jgi:hypothetical protein